MDNYNELKVLNNANSVCLITHLNPDVDAISSLIVFSTFIKEQFGVKKVDLFADCQALPENMQSIVGDNLINPTPSSYDIAVMLDAPNSSRLGIFESLFVGAKTKIVIDHHLTNNHCGDINIVEFVCSTCEILYSILSYYNYTPIDKLCECIYAGIITDTNNFSVGNFNKKTFETVAQIADKVDIPAIYRQHFSNSLRSTRIFARAVDNLAVLHNGRILISYIDIEFAIKNNLQDEDFVGIINRLATISKSIFVCLIYPLGDRYNVSLRAKDPYNVAEIALKFNGGGHKGAAAFVSDQPIEKIKKQIADEFEIQLNKK